ncbi:IS630 family transposase [Acinetobacter sp. MD2(2019)]|uniref:IS630 family transposase n=1 Tax=Acinetobacter sp. MD2(2019) TaxID=2605273 RepID=UPI002D76E6AD|nr:IS630 family transposase [Acinetobacter sp. MD2(2019)]
MGRAVFQWFLPQWKQQYGEEHILYMDESGINSNEVADYGWSEKGKRCHAIKSGGHGTRLSMISAVCSNAAFKFIAPFIFQGSCDRSTFAGWLEYLLKGLPKDKSGQHQKHLLILDNASIHKGKEIDELATQYNARLMYLPTYSPDFNPIEKAWSVLKRKVRNIVSQKHKNVIEALDIAFNEM